MEYENYWIVDDEGHEDLKYTENICKIMEQQCRYLFDYTNGCVFAAFDEIKTEGSIIATAKTMANAFRILSGKMELQETIAESSTKNLIDANNMYFDKRYGFEICTEEYRFRVFELRMTPIYPVEINIDEGICKNIRNTLDRVAIPMEKVNYFRIGDEEAFCNVLQAILQDKKVRYIVGELQKRVQERNANKENLPGKVIICEGQTDEIVLQAIAKKLNKEVTIVVANGKYNVPAVLEGVRMKSSKPEILVVVDSDGDEEQTRNIIVEKLGVGGYELAIVNSCIEDWFMPETEKFSKLKFMYLVNSMVEEADFEELGKAHKSFAKVVEFLQR